MGCDMVAALGRATVDGHTLFGHNSGQPARQGQSLRVVRGRPFELGQMVRTQHLELPQARQTYTVLGSQAAGTWGYEHGVNDHGVAVGRAPLRTRLLAGAGLTGSEIVRLVLERAANARQALDQLTDLVHRHGQGSNAAVPGASDNAFLIADAREAFAVETAGNYWVCQHVEEVRALGAVCTVRQDWDRIARGLSEHAIAQGWWPEDGSKLDFAGAVCPALVDQKTALHRWGRATYLLGQQNRHIDTAFVRRMLADHSGDDVAAGGEEPPLPAQSLCQHPGDAIETATAASLVVQLSAAPDRLLCAWCAFGPPCLAVYFPVFLQGELPEAFTAGEGGAVRLWARTCQLQAALEARDEMADAFRDHLGRLQARFDQEAEEFAAEGAALKQQGDSKRLQRQASLFMDHCLERYEEMWDGMIGRSQRIPVQSVAP
jgi:secernin